MTQPSGDKPLALPQVDDIASQLGNGQANSVDAELEAKADRFIEDILAEGEDVSRGASAEPSMRWGLNYSSKPPTVVQCYRRRYASWPTRATKAVR